MQFKIAVLAGDGIGPEICTETVKVLNAVAKKYGHTFNYEYGLVGGIAIDATGSALPQKSIDICKAADAVLFLVGSRFTTGQVLFVDGGRHLREARRG